MYCEIIKCSFLMCEPLHVIQTIKMCERSRKMSLLRRGGAAWDEILIQQIL